jgi:hypothetical protein
MSVADEAGKEAGGMKGRKLVLKSRRLQDSQVRTAKLRFKRGTDEIERA